jgi:hypothetical protein
MKTLGFLIPFSRWFLVWIAVSGSIRPLVAFTPCQSKRVSSSTTNLSSVGNWISGVTGSPPSQPLLAKKELETALVSGTSLQDKELACVYKASQDGWSAIDFHQAADGKGSSLVVALSRSGQVFGGFNPLGWRSTDDYYSSNAAFLWFANGNNKATKCPILPGGTYDVEISSV